MDIGYKKYFANERTQTIKNISIFLILTLGFHLLFNYWTYSLNYLPFNVQIQSLYNYLTNLAYENSVCLLRIMTDNNIKTNSSSRTIWYGSGSIYISSGCSGLKQFLQWIVLILIFPGPYRHKLWFMPVGLLLLYIFNVLRIIGLTFVHNYSPSYWNFFHLYFFRFLFYGIIFVLWVIWVEKFYLTNSKINC